MSKELNEIIAKTFKQYGCVDFILQDGKHLLSQGIANNVQALISTEVAKAKIEVLDKLNLYYLQHDGEGEHKLAAQFDIMKAEVESNE